MFNINELPLLLDFYMIIISVLLNIMKNYAFY